VILKLAAITLARTVAFVEILDLDPHGRIFYPEFFAGLIKQYNFQKFPQKYEEFDIQKGIEFAAGNWKKGTIDRLFIYSGAIAVDTRSSTDDAEQFLDESLTWASETLGLHYRDGMIKRKGYVSQLTFYSETAPLRAISNSVSKLADRVSDAINNITGEKISYELSNLWIHSDQTTRKLSPAPFTIQRRLDIPFTENKYFSEAPLPTDVHLKMLEDFEADLLRT